MFDKTSKVQQEVSLLCDSQVGRFNGEIGKTFEARKSAYETALTRANNEKLVSFEALAEERGNEVKNWVEDECRDAVKRVQLSEVKGSRKMQEQCAEAASELKQVVGKAKKEIDAKAMHVEQTAKEMVAETKREGTQMWDGLKKSEKEIRAKVEKREKEIWSKLQKLEREVYAKQKKLFD